MARLIKKSQNFIGTDPIIIAALEELLNLELTSIVRFKYNEIITTGIFHDSVVPNFEKIFEDDSHHAWEIAMILTSYGIKPKLNAMQVDFFPSVYDFITEAISIKKTLIYKYDIARRLLNDSRSPAYDPGAVTVLEEIMAEERINLAELIKLADQSSLC